MNPQKVAKREMALDLRRKSLERVDLMGANSFTIVLSKVTPARNSKFTQSFVAKYLQSRVSLVK